MRIVLVDQTHCHPACSHLTEEANNAATCSLFYRNVSYPDKLKRDPKNMLFLRSPSCAAVGASAGYTTKVAPADVTARATEIENELLRYTLTTLLEQQADKQTLASLDGGETGESSNSTEDDAEEDPPIVAPLFIDMDDEIVRKRKK